MVKTLLQAWLEVWNTRIVGAGSNGWKSTGVRLRKQSCTGPSACKCALCFCQWPSWVYLLTTLRELDIDTVLLLVSHINFNSELLAFETVLFLICSIYNLYDLSQSVFDSVGHTLRSSFISLPVTCLCCLPAVEVWSDENTQCCCLQKWLPTWHSTVHQLPTWILIAFRSVFLPVIFLSPFLAWCAFLPLVPHSSSSTPLLSSFHQISPAQSSTAIRVVSFNQASSSAYFYPLYILCFPIFLSSSQSLVSSKCSGRLRSCNVSSLFELETALSPLFMFPPTTLSHLSSSNTRPILSVHFSVSSWACLMLFHLLCYHVVYLPPSLQLWKACPFFSHLRLMILTMRMELSIRCVEVYIIQAPQKSVHGNLIFGSHIGSHLFHYSGSLK